MEKARAIHGDRYDYSLVEYTGTQKKVTVICKKHGEFFVIPSQSVNKSVGCREYARPLQ